MDNLESKDIIHKISTGELKCVKNEIGKSAVWKHFLEIVDAQSKKKLEYVQCETCKCVLKYKSSSGSSRLSRHSKTCAPSCSASKPIEQYFHPSPKQITAEQKKNILDSCVKLCTEDLRPFDIVEGQGFVHLAQNLINLGATLGKVKVTDVLPHRTTISKHVRQTAENCRNQILPGINVIIQDVGGALTTDLWTEPFRQTSYICITCHYIDEQFELRPIVLSTGSFPNISKTSGNILNEILETLKKIGFDVALLNKCTFVTDEGSNIVSALKCYKRVTCICHLLNTVLKHSYSETADEFPVLKSSVEKCKSLVRYLKKSGAVNDLSKTVHQEVECRWNTLFLMLESILTQYNEIKELLQKRHEGHRLDNIFPDSIQTLLNFLKIFQEASSKLEGDLYPTLHRVLLWTEYLKKHCTENVTDTQLEKCLKANAKKWIQKKIVITEIHKIATFLHPKFKSLKMLQNADKLNIYQKVRQMLAEVSPKDCNESATSDTANSNKIVGDLCSHTDIFDEWTDNDTIECSVDEVQSYIELSVIDEINDKDLLVWWKKSPFQNLAKVARNILCIPASSATSERDFSVAGRVLEERRCNLSPDAVDAILFLKNYAKNKAENISNC